VLSLAGSYRVRPGNDSPGLSGRRAQADRLRRALDRRLMCVTTRWVYALSWASSSVTGASRSTT